MKKEEITKLKKDSRIYYYSNRGKKKYGVSFKRTILGHLIPFRKRGFESSADAAMWADDQLRLARLKGGNAKNITLGEYYDIWINRGIAANKWTPQTIHGYRQKFEGFILPYFKNTLLEEITRESAQNFIFELENKKLGDRVGYSTSTVRSVYGYLKTLLNDAVYSGVLSANRVQRCDIKQNVHKRDTSITLEDYNKIVSVAENSSKPYELAEFYLAMLALRHAEILGLKPKDVFLDHVEIRRSRPINQPEGGKTKTADSVRDVPITPKVHEALVAAIDQGKQRCIANNIEFNDNSFIFVNLRGAPSSYSDMNHYFERLSLISGIDIFPHKLRHAFATFSMPKAADKIDVMKVMGHKNMDMTNFYDNGTKEGQEKIVSMIDRLAK